MRRIDLYPHNREAFERAEAMLNKEGKAAVIHPTGTGKSFIAFALIERHRDKRFLWMAPTEYIYNLQMEKLWQKQHVRFHNVVFYTYNRLMWHEEEIRHIKPDFIILDEFHRVGALEWGKTTRKLIKEYPKAKVLGLSATNIRYLDNGRDMANEIFGGCVASEMGICDAMAQKILPEPKYVIAGYAYEHRVEMLENRAGRMQNRCGKAETRKLIERLRRALEKSAGLPEIFAKHMPDKHGKVIIFCKDSEHMFQMVSNVPEWFAKTDVSPHVYRVYSHNPESEEDFKRFKDDDSDHLKLLYCIDMLNEGIHVDGISAVVLCRPTISPIVFKQQIGRAIAAGGVEQPVIFDLVNNFDNLKPIANLQDEYKRAKGKGTGVRPNADNSDISGFDVIDELRDCRELIEQIQHNIETSWNVCYQEYAKYAEENGTTRIPRRYVTDTGLQLGRWLQRQKTKYRNGKLADDEIEMLEKYGIDWEYESDKNFMHWVGLLKKYKEKYGNLRVNYVFVWKEEDEAENEDAHAGMTRHDQRMRNKKLGEWCNVTRRLYRQGKLLPERIEILEKMGFVWDNPDYYWEEGYRHARDYYEEHGNINTTTKYTCEDGYHLGSWLNRQRKVREGKERGMLTDEKIRLLDEMGMVWSLSASEIKPNRAAFEIFLSAYKKYKAEHPEGVVPAQYIDENDIRLGSWAGRMRRAFNQGTLRQEQYDKLKDAGFPFYYYSTYWHKHYLEAKTFFEEHGHLHVPQTYMNEKGGSLYTWIGKQKEEYLKPGHGNLSDTQVYLLEEIDITRCRRMHDRYSEMLEAYRQYVEDHNDNLVPLSYITPEGRKLGKWLSHQRTKYRNGTLEESRIKLLEEIGVEWENYETVYARRYWNEMYEEAKKYAAEHGSIAGVPHCYETEDGKKLGQWITQQRGIHKGVRKHSITMTGERVSMLDAIGMNWNP